MAEVLNVNSDKIKSSKVLETLGLARGIYITICS